MIRGAHDGNSTNEDLLDFYAQLANGDRQFVILPHTAHSIGYSNNRHLLWYAVRNFLQCAGGGFSVTSKRINFFFFFFWGGGGGGGGGGGEKKKKKNKRHAKGAAAGDAQLPVLRRGAGESEITREIVEPFGIGAVRRTEPVLQVERRGCLIIERRRHGGGPTFHSLSSAALRYSCAVAPPLRLT